MEGKKMTEVKKKFEINLDDVGIDDDFSDGLEGSKTITAGMVTCGKPNKSEWFRVRGDKIADIKTGISVAMAAADGNEHDFYVHGSGKFCKRVKEDFKTCKKFFHANYKTSAGRYGIWPVTIPQGNYTNKWASTALDIITNAQKSWVRMISNTTNQHYECWVADEQNEFPQLVWEIDAKKQMEDAWEDLILHEGNYETHPYVRKALGGKSLDLKGGKDE